MCLSPPILSLCISKNSLAPSSYSLPFWSWRQQWYLPLTFSSLGQTSAGPQPLHVCSLSFQIILSDNWQWCNSAAKDSFCLVDSPLSELYHIQNITWTLIHFSGFKMPLSSQVCFAEGSRLLRTPFPWECLTVEMDKTFWALSADPGHGGLHSLLF